MRLHCFVKLPDHIIQMVYPEPVSLLQGFEPTIDLIDGLERIIQRQFNDSPLELLGITQRMIRARRKKIQHHGDQSLIPDSGKYEYRFDDIG